MASCETSNPLLLRGKSQIFRAIVLAAQRPGRGDPLAATYHVSHKCLIPLAGRPLIAHVLETLARHPHIDEIVVSIERGMEDVISEIVGGLGADCPIRCTASARNIADSVLEAASGHDGPLLITTADNALLQPDGISALLASLRSGSDVSIAMAPKKAVLAAHADGQRRFYRFADDEYSNCNLYGIAGPYALAAAEIFRTGGQFAKKMWRVIDSFGLLNLILLRFRMVSLSDGLERVSNRVGLTIAPVILSDGRQAIDVDNERTYAVVEEILLAGSYAAKA